MSIFRRSPDKSLNSGVRYHKEIMTKQETIQVINNKSGVKILGNHNTHFSNINKAKDVWWFNIPLAKFNNDLYLILNRIDGFIVLKISANTFARLKDVFRIKQKQWVDLEISSDKNYIYMIDIKSGGTKYNFNQHVICRCNQTS